MIVNISSVSAFELYPQVPVYGGTKSAIVTFSKLFGNEFFFNKSKVRIIAIVPGATVTETVKLAQIQAEKMGIRFTDIQQS